MERMESEVERCSPVHARTREARLRFSYALLSYALQCSLPAMLAFTGSRLVETSCWCAGWEPEEHILDKRLVRSFFRKRERAVLVPTRGKVGPSPSRKSSRKGIEAAGERARLASNADHREPASGDGG